MRALWLSNRGRTRSLSSIPISTVARRLDVSEKSVRRYIERGRLPAYKIGGQIRIAEEDVRAFLSSCRLSKGRYR